jgi:hypothetical protein
LGGKPIPDDYRRRLQALFIDYELDTGRPYKDGLFLTEKSDAQGEQEKAKDHPLPAPKPILAADPASNSSPGPSVDLSKGWPKPVVRPAGPPKAPLSLGSSRPTVQPTTTDDKEDKESKPRRSSIVTTASSLAQDDGTATPKMPTYFKPNVADLDEQLALKLAAEVLDIYDDLGFDARRVQINLRSKFLATTMSNTFLGRRGTSVEAG